MPNWFLNPPFILMSLTAVIAVTLFLVEHFTKKRLPPDDRFNQKTISEADKMVFGKLADEVERSTQIMNQAEEVVLNIDKTIKPDLHQAEEHIINSLAQSSNELEQELKTETKQILNNLEQNTSLYNNFLQELRQRSEQAELQNQEIIKQRVNQLFENFEEKLSEFLVKTEQKSIMSIEMELGSIRQLVDSYKAQQLRLIDENIVAMLEKTLSLVLAKKLTLKDEMDLIYEALEKAKAEKFVV